MQGMKFCSPCNLFTMLNKMLWLLCSGSSLRFCRGRQIFFFFPDPIDYWSVISVFGRIIQNDFAFYFRVTTQKGSFTSLNSNEKKKMFPSARGGLVYYLYLYWHQMSVPLCYVSPRLQHLPGRLQRRDPPPTWLAAGNVRHRSGTVSGTNWEQGTKKMTSLQDFALLERQAQNRVALVFQLITNELENSCLDDFVTFSAVT